MIDYLGHGRRYRLHVPQTYDGSAPIPLVISLHGLWVDGAQQEIASQFTPVGEEHGFAVVYPTSDTESWNAGTCCNEGGPDDVAFMRELVAQIEKRVCIDEKRVYAAGPSNGGAMAYRLACDAADLFAAAAVVSAPLPVPAERCLPARPISVLQIHGENDPFVAYEGGGFVALIVTDPNTPLLSAPETVAGWARRNMCAEGPSTPTSKSEWPKTPLSGVALPNSGGDVFPPEIIALGAATAGEPGASCEWYTNCAAGTEVGLCTHAGQHDWPTGSSTAIWQFFARHPMP